MKDGIPQGIVSNLLQLFIGCTFYFSFLCIEETLDNMILHAFSFPIFR